MPVLSLLHTGVLILFMAENTLSNSALEAGSTAILQVCKKSVDRPLHSLLIRRRVQELPMVHLVHHNCFLICPPHPLSFVAGCVFHVSQSDTRTSPSQNS